MLCMLGKLYVVCQTFSKLTFSKNSFRNTTKVLNCLDPDLVPNCLQMLSADGKSCRYKGMS